MNLGQNDTDPGFFSRFFTSQPDITPSPLTATQRKEWDNLFLLARSMEPLFAVLDELNALEISPAFINEPWTTPFVEPKNGKPAVERTWPNYKEMRLDYLRAGAELRDEYENITGVQVTFLAGPWGLPAVLYVITIVTVGVIVTSTFLTGAVNIYLETDPERSKALIANAKATAPLLEAAAKDAGVTIPALIKKALDFLTLGLFAFGGWLIYKVVLKK